MGSMAPPKLTPLTRHLFSSFLSFYAVTCWALGTISGIEAWTRLKYGEESKLSLQELLNCCDRNPKNDDDKYVDKYQFYSSSSLDAFLWIESNGIQLEKDYKWEGELGASTVKKMKWNGIKLDSHENISTDEESLLIALNKGPVVGAILFDKGGLLSLDKKDIWDGIPCIPAPDGKYKYHVGVFSGYGTTDSGKKIYWFQSSWGSRWGESGYGRILRKSSYNSKNTPPADLICKTRIPGTIHKVVNGKIQRANNYSDVDEEKKPQVIKDYLEPAIGNYNYNSGTHLILESVEKVLYQKTSLVEKYDFMFNAKAPDNNMRKFKAQIIKIKEGYVVIKYEEVKVV
ncbi:cathepsin L-like proteinase [Salvia hispanica]|uniref:cathepsin L-like proteinase n=1 Tax=Salvia hispanica TaxID=49212 RepID=UPI002009C3DE|nr:cathepsin L-like proteinase [Salvia hispanica]